MSYIRVLFVCVCALTILLVVLTMLSLYVGIIHKIIVVSSCKLCNYTTLHSSGHVNYSTVWLVHFVWLNFHFTPKLRTEFLVLNSRSEKLPANYQYTQIFINFLSWKIPAIWYA